MDKAADNVTPELGADDPIADARAYMAMCNTADGSNRDAALDDLRFLSGDQWDAAAKRQRETDGRPCLTINKLPTFLHQVTNDQRMNVPGIYVSPVDSGADKKTAEVIQGYIRHTEYISNASIAYDTAVNSAAAVGFGYFRIVTDYCDPKSFDQDIRFKRIRNPFTVYFDPTSQEPDGSDQKRCLITERLTKADFQRQYPGKQFSGTPVGPAGVGDSTGKDWYGADFVRVAEFYRIEYTEETLVLLPDGSTEYKSELDAAGVVIPDGTKTRPTQRERVKWYKLTAFEVLESTEIKCKWIPVFPVFGDEIDVDGVVIRSGIIRNAKDPARMYNFWMTAATEEVALRPKTPYIGAEGQFEGYEDDWNSANTTSFSYLEYKPVTLDGQLAPPPMRQPMTDLPSGVLTMAMHANDNIKATTGLFDSSLGALGNARSGVQERSQQRQGDVANYHFTDNLNRTILQAGRCIISMIPHYLDAPRLIRCMGEDGTIKPVRVNSPEPQPDTTTPGPAVQMPQVPPGGAADGAMVPMPGTLDPQQQQAIATVLHDLTVGEYDVTVKAGPSYSTMREEAADAMIQLGSKWPKLMDVAGDKVIRSMDWPGANEIADRIAKTIPPELRDEEEGDAAAPVVNTPKGPIPVEQAGQMLAEMDAQMQEMGQRLQQADAGLEKARIESDSRIRVAELNNEGRQDVEELKGMVQLLLAKQMPAPPGLQQEVAGELAEKPQNETTQILARLTQLMEQQAMPAPPPAKRRKRVSIQAPSGAVYTGEIGEDDEDEAPTGFEGMQ